MTDIIGSLIVLTVASTGFAFSFVVATWVITRGVDYIFDRLVEKHG